MAKPMVQTKDNVEEKCYITGKECEFWESGDPGECLAVFIEQCPISDKE